MGASRAITGAKFAIIKKISKLSDVYLLANFICHIFAVY